MIYQVRHVTRYAYIQPVMVSHQLAHLVPRATATQERLSATLRIDPPPTMLDEAKGDYFGNPVTYFAIHAPHKTMTVESRCGVRVRAPLLPDAYATPAWEAVRDRLAAACDDDARAAGEYLFDSPFVPFDEGAASYAVASFPPGRPVLAAVVDLTARIHRDFAYDPSATTLATPLKTVLAQRRGVCQDFAHLAIACLRAQGLAARYVSGYLLTRPPAGVEKLVGSDASHAWLSVWVPGAGWIDTDPTNDILPALDHVTLAWGRDYDDVSPLKGVVLGGGEHNLDVAVDVVPEGEAM